MAGFATAPPPTSRPSVIGNEMHSQTMKLLNPLRKELTGCN